MSLEGLGYSFVDNICGWLVVWVSECMRCLLIMIKYTVNLKKKRVKIGSQIEFVTHSTHQTS